MKQVIHDYWGKLGGKGWGKKNQNWGKVEYLGLSPITVSYPQSYPRSFPRLLQSAFPQSTASTTITNLITIYLVTAL